MKYSCTLLLVLSFSAGGFAQEQLSGVIVKKKSAEFLAGVNIVNLTRKAYATSDTSGKFKIRASLGDTILFSSAGYLPDTVRVAAFMLSEDYLIPLTPYIATLPSLTVDEMGKYQADSMRRREEYSFILDKKHPVKFWNEKRASDGPGLSFSPIGFFSRKEKQKRRLKKRLQEEEEYYYINYKYSSSRVAQLTQLKGDSLQQFMWRSRPTYQFCRKASNQDIFLYINDKLKLFRAGKLQATLP